MMYSILAGWREYRTTYVEYVQRKYNFVALGWGPDQEACPTNVMEWF
jgi:hypothetical protein